MYAICSTKLNDVKNCVKEMVKQIASDEPGSMAVASPIVQFGSTIYKRLDENRSLTTKLVTVNKLNKRSKPVPIYIRTLTIHKKDCSHRGRHTNVVGARLINIPKTGLKVCGHCS